MRNILLGAMAVAALVVSIAAVAEGGGEPPVFSTDAGAIRGYDPVAYFTEGKPLRGETAFTHRWKGANWYFASADHCDRFAANPERYAPQYGGYCSWAMSRGYYATTVPEAWHIHEGKLYLNFSLAVRERWRKDIPGNIAKADKNWARLQPGAMSAQ